MAARINECETFGRKGYGVGRPSQNIGVAARMTIRMVYRLLVIANCASVAWMMACNPGLAQDSKDAPPLVLVHYMPWFEAKPVSANWGWHWTMNAKNPDKRVNSRPEIAAHFHPLIGPYDSGDPDVLEYHLLLMRVAGIDGVIVDWYGLEEFRDFALLHRNTLKLVDQLQGLGLKFAICYEDQTIPALVNAGRLTDASRVEHVKREIDWMQKNWFPLKSYVTHDGQPLLLSFGQDGLTDQEWSTVLAGQTTNLAYFSLHHKRSAAVGAFDWPLPKEGVAAVDRFQAESKSWPAAMTVAFPRFKDFYANANVHPSWGEIEDDDGRTFEKTLIKGQRASMLQIATWNDWGEGTQIEPSTETRYRDLEIIQRFRSRLGGRQSAFSVGDLEIPSRLLELRRNQVGPQSNQRLNEISKLLSDGQTTKCRRLLEQLQQ